eukprot:gnl/Chilomastix_cuspidata/955.p1 GENE.gnl/Chilomastix_cuspidata/955~~gnl/Chilomastix_cuspidata/955.p1  ORF type:complete len:975 (+),score=214.83 gnl/Chilomastix_cuspidata/955:61-2985(+)
MQALRIYEEVSTYIIQCADVVEVESGGGGTVDVCPVCFLTPVVQYIAPCGHAYCRECAKLIPACALCRQLTNCTYTTRANVALRAARIRCPLECGWVGAGEDYTAHLSACSVPCAACGGARVPLHDFHAHLLSAHGALYDVYTLLPLDSGGGGPDALVVHARTTVRQDLSSCVLRTEALAEALAARGDEPGDAPVKELRVRAPLVPTHTLFSALAAAPALRVVHLACFYDRFLLDAADTANALERTARTLPCLEELFVETTDTALAGHLFGLAHAVYERGVRTAGILELILHIHGLDAEPIAEDAAKSCCYGGDRLSNAHIRNIGTSLRRGLLCLDHSSDVVFAAIFAQPMPEILDRVRVIQVGSASSGTYGEYILSFLIRQFIENPLIFPALRRISLPRQIEDKNLIEMHQLISLSTGLLDGQRPDGPCRHSFKITGHPAIAKVTRAHHKSHLQFFMEDKTLNMDGCKCFALLVNNIQCVHPTFFADVTEFEVSINSGMWKRKPEPIYRAIGVILSQMRNIRTLVLKTLFPELLGYMPAVREIIKGIMRAREFKTSNRFLEVMWNKTQNIATRFRAGGDGRVLPELVLHGPPSLMSVWAEELAKMFPAMTTSLRQLEVHTVYELEYKDLRNRMFRQELFMYPKNSMWDYYGPYPFEGVRFHMNNLFLRNLLAKFFPKVLVIHGPVVRGGELPDETPLELHELCQPLMRIPKVIFEDSFVQSVFSVIREKNNKLVIDGASHYSLNLAMAFASKLTRLQHLIIETPIDGSVCMRLANSLQLMASLRCVRVSNFKAAQLSDIALLFDGFALLAKALAAVKSVSTNSAVLDTFVACERARLCGKPAVLSFRGIPLAFATILLERQLENFAFVEALELWNEPFEPISASTLEQLRKAIAQFPALKRLGVHIDASEEVMTSLLGAFEQLAAGTLRVLDLSTNRAFDSPSRSFLERIVALAAVPTLDVFADLPDPTAPPQ